MGKKYTYAVEKKWRGTTKTMFHSKDYKKAVAFYHKHPRASYIQRYVGGLYGLTAGSLQPRIPNKIRYRGKQYSRAYKGPHTKREAKKMAKSFRKQAIFKGAVAKKFKKGWFVFTRS